MQIQNQKSKIENLKSKIENLKSKIYDVVICGGGLAGQTLARQLRLNLPELSILLLEKATFPRPIAALKVGESLVESSAFYLAEVLQLAEYLDEHELRKLGLRYFWSDPTDCLSEQPEIGLSRYGSYPSYQIDRGQLENHLACTNREMGVEMIEGVRVKEIQLGDASRGALHEIHYRHIENKKRRESVQARWVVDAMGRRRFLQKKLGLLIKNQHHVHSAVWFRVKGRLDICDLVPESETPWHERVPDRMRYYSTNHLMGDGYWIWLIPLSSGYTSVGIVTGEPFHLIDDYSTLERAMEWLDTNEPALYKHLQKFEVVDFDKIRDFSFSSKQILSEERWACIGDSALFSDPFYSPGVVLLGYENSMLTKMIELERDGRLTAEQVHQFNLFARSINQYDTVLIQKPYDYFDYPHIWSLRHLWALALSWGTIYPQMFNSIYLDSEKSQKISEITGPISLLAFRLESFFNEWAAKSDECFSFQFIDYLSLPFLRELYERNTKRYDDFAQVIENYHHALATLEELIQVIFLMALRDLMPETLARLPEPLWLNPQAISLDPTRWEQDGLFQAKTAPRDLSAMRAQIENLYEF